VYQDATHCASNYLIEWLSSYQGCRRLGYVESEFAEKESLMVDVFGRR
jgi:hypothetical protein